MPCSGRGKGSGCGKEEPTTTPTVSAPPWQETPQAAGTGKCLRTHLGHSPASSQACSSPRRVCEGGQCQQHRPHVHPQEEDILPEEPQHWLSLCSLPWGLSWPVQVFKVEGSSQTSLQASSPNSVLPFPSPSPGRISWHIPASTSWQGAACLEFRPPPPPVCCLDSPGGHCQPSQTPRSPGPAQVLRSISDAQDEGAKSKVTVPYGQVH